MTRRAACIAVTAALCEAGARTIRRADAVSTIEVHGARYPEHLQKMVGR